MDLTTLAVLVAAAGLFIQKILGSTSKLRK